MVKLILWSFHKNEQDKVYLWCKYVLCQVGCCHNYFMAFFKYIVPVHVLSAYLCSFSIEKKYSDVWKELPQDWLQGLNIKRQVWMQHVIPFL